MKRKNKRVLAILSACMLMTSLVPANSFAADIEPLPSIDGMSVTEIKTVSMNNKDFKVAIFTDGVAKGYALVGNVPVDDLDDAQKALNQVTGVVEMPQSRSIQHCDVNTSNKSYYVREIEEDGNLHVTNQSWYTDSGVTHPDGHATIKSQSAAAWYGSNNLSTLTVTTNMHFRVKGNSQSFKFSNTGMGWSVVPTSKNEGELRDSYTAHNTKIATIQPGEVTVSNGDLFGGQIIECRTTTQGTMPISTGTKTATATIIYNVNTY